MDQANSFTTILFSPGFLTLIGVAILCTTCFAILKFSLRKPTRASGRDVGRDVGRARRFEGQLQEKSRSARQIEAVSASGFQTIPLLNRSESAILPLIEAATIEFAPDHRVMAQTSLGEILCPTEGPNAEAAYSAINAKRLGFAIFDPDGNLVAALEYQGKGHHRKDGFLRDAVKREALRKAGVPMIELPPDVSSGMIRQRLHDVFMAMRSASLSPITDHPEAAE